MPVRMVACRGSTGWGNARTVANCAAVKPMDAAARLIATARNTAWRLSSSTQQAAGIATAIPSQSGGSERNAK